VGSGEREKRRQEREPNLRWGLVGGWRKTIGDNKGRNERTATSSRIAASEKHLLKSEKILVYIRHKIILEKDGDLGPEPEGQKRKSKHFRNHMYEKRKRPEPPRVTAYVESLIVRFARRQYRRSIEMKGMKGTGKIGNLN